MSMTGGPAYPCTESEYYRGELVSAEQHSGMTMLDYFAGQALCGILAKGNFSHPQDCARNAYNVAEAMVIEKTRRQG